MKRSSPSRLVDVIVRVSLPKAVRGAFLGPHGFCKGGIPRYIENTERGIDGGEVRSCSTRMIQMFIEPPEQIRRHTDIEQPLCVSRFCEPRSIDTLEKPSSRCLRLPIGTTLQNVDSIGAG